MGGVRLCDGWMHTYKSKKRTMAKKVLLPLFLHVGLATETLIMLSATRANALKIH